MQKKRALQCKQSAAERYKKNKLARQTGNVRLRPEDQKLVFLRAWADDKIRLSGVHALAGELAALATKSGPSK